MASIALVLEHRIGSDPRQVVDREGGDDAVTADTDLSLAAMIAGVDIGVEAFDAVGNEFHWPPQQFG